MILPKMNGYVKTFKVKDGDKDKNNKLSIKNNKISIKPFELRLKACEILNWRILRSILWCRKTVKIWEVNVDNIFVSR